MNEIQTPPAQANVPTSTPSRRRTRLWIAGAATCALVVAGGIAVTTAFASSPVAAIDERPTSTTPIERGTLSGAKTVGGVLDYAGARDLQAGVGGILTHLPTPGSEIGQGGELYRVDNAPVFLLLGDLPAWRAFERGMDDGPDVAQLQQALQQLGFYDAGYTIDGVYDWVTRQAVIAWQEATGQEQTGRLELGRIVFAPTALRVGELKAAVGDAVGPGAALYRVSGLDKRISADVKLGDQKLLQTGIGVEVNMPDGSTVGGTITSVGQVTERANGGGPPSQIIPITITLDDPSVADGLQRANVTIDIPSEVREDVLSVPIDALLALPGGGFGVEVVRPDGTTEQMPVSVGLFAGGRVEISGNGLEAGLDVVVPTR